MNFHLKSSSPCINAGDPNDPLDYDSSYTDIGAFSYDSRSLIVINEINYNSSDVFDSGDWVELYNPQDVEINISGWIFKDGNNEHKYIFSEGVKIESKGYLILCNNCSKFQTNYQGIENLSGDFDFKLSSDGETIRLFGAGASGEIIDSLTYDDEAPWPIEPDGKGATLELINPVFNNSIPANWASSKNHGTPGRTNSVLGDSTNNKAPEFSYVLYQNYPNPFNHKTIINFNLPESGEVKLKIYNITGQLVKSIKLFTASQGKNTFIWDTKDLSSGIYFYQIELNEKYSVTKKAILLK